MNEDTVVLFSQPRPSTYCRYGYLPEREIQTGIGAVGVQAPRVRDRSGGIRFTSSILPRYLRRRKSVEELLPWLYLKGSSGGEHHRAAQGGVVGGIRSLAAARPVGAALRLFLG